MEIALIQFRPEIGKPEANIAKLDELFTQTGSARLIVLPELASTGYNFTGFDEAYACSEELSDSRFIDFLALKAKEKQAHIISGINERVGDKLYNASVLVDGNGVLAKYHKIHLFMNEKHLFQPGEGDLPVLDIGECKVGMLICFDYLFPEVWRAEAMRGADIICHPSNLITLNAHRSVPGLSIQNRVFIATANRTGTERGLWFSGQSFITSPSGEVLAMGTADQDEVITAELDVALARSKFINPINHVFNDRRPDLYDRL